MSLTLKKGREGSLRPYWYAEVEVDGKRRVFNLGVRWKGTPPLSLREEGDKIFEASRAKAQAELVRLSGEAKEKGQFQHLTRRLIQSKSGQEVEYIQLSELADRWRLGNPSTVRHLEICDMVFRHFLTALEDLQPGSVYVYEVTRTTVEHYAAMMREQLSSTTARRRLRMLKTSFSRSLPVGSRNPFDPLPWPRGAGAGDEIHRVPFTADELARVLAEAKASDPALHALVVCGACTGLRLGDLCRLRWDAVNLNDNIVAVKTSKTGEKVEIPIFPPLRTVFDELGAKGTAKKQVQIWPWAAQIIESKSRQTLTLRFKRVVARALAEPVNVEGEVVESLLLVDILADVEAAVRQASIAESRRERILECVSRYAQGQSVRTIEKNTGRLRGRISEDLHFAEKVSGKRFMPVRSGKSITQTLNDLTRCRRPGNGRMASTRDWHALRTTWAALALSAGVPIEVARHVTGHRTIEVILTNYFKPQREHLRKALADKLPDVLTGGKVEVPVENAPDAEMKLLAERVGSGKATAEEKARLRELLSPREDDVPPAKPKKPRKRTL